MFSFHNLNWPPNIEFIYSPFALVAMLHGEKYAQVEFGEDGNLILGASEEAVIDWMRQPKNKKTLELIRKDAYPDLHGIE